jgi:hypothetical protein
MRKGSAARFPLIFVTILISERGRLPPQLKQARDGSFSGLSKHTHFTRLGYPHGVVSLLPPQHLAGKRPLADYQSVHDRKKLGHPAQKKLRVSAGI